MKTIIAGSRNGVFLRHVTDAMEHCPWLNEITEVVSGCAPGVDVCGRVWANSRSIPIKDMPAEWNKHQPADPLRKNPAGMIRNAQMAEYADALVAVWDERSTGTKDMIAQAKDRGHRIFVWNPFTGREVKA